MYIKSLTIEGDGSVIRDIQFHKGMNFIVDETKLPNSNERESGNNIGKTTVLRLINFCLGSSGKEIYQSKEFKNNVNEEVRDFLIDGEVVVTLKLRECLDDPLSRQVEIRRNFLSNRKKLLEVDGVSVQAKDLDGTLKKAIFGYEEEKPTFKQLKAKNVRDDSERLENTVRVLGNFGKLEEYEALYLFWLGVGYPDAEEKRRLLEDKKVEEKLYSRLVRDNSESKIKQFLAIVERDIGILESKKDTFNINEEYEKDLDGLNQIRAELNSLYSRQSQLSLRRDLIEESREELERDMASGSSSQVSELYSQAKALIPDLQKTFEDTLEFHNKMILEKISYVSEELPVIQKELVGISSSIQLSLERERQYVEVLHKADSIEELQGIISELNKKYELRGRLEEKSAQLDKAKETLGDIDGRLSEIDRSISGLDDLVQEKVSSFNGFFSEISNNLYGEQFAMSASFEQKKNTDNYFYKLYIDSLNGQTGTGKKKGEIAAFDIAYVKFAEKEKVPCLHFILHDQMEVVDDNQLVGLVKEVVGARCQFVVPILRDKLPAILDRPEYRALSLSQEDKLFRI